MGASNKHHYFRFYKFGYGKVIREEPLEITGGGETVPAKRNSCKGNGSKKNPASGDT